ncbi:hypothetical protein BGX34_002891 [Mortierella sp. NVP85]|nr:hypothetical protein BGX34_002891 [Mortierella sp. NVP85]
MSSLEIFGKNVDNFWSLCTRLEQLEISLQHRIDITLPPGEYPNLKHLGVYGCNAKMVPFFMGFLRQCPHLTSIAWRTVLSRGAGFISGLSELLEANALPNLECVIADTKGIRKGLFTKLIQNLPLRINTLSVRFSRRALKLDFAMLLQPHFMNLRVLEVPGDVDVKNSFAQLVMSSCPLLEKLTAPNVDALVVTEGEPWPLVFGRLSKLTRLEEMRMLGPKKHHNIGGTVDLRLEYGLDKLSTLRLLRFVSLRDMVEKMDNAEVDWMLEHWKSLTLFNGRLNTWDSSTREALETKLEGYGIRLLRYID